MDASETLPSDDREDAEPKTGAEAEARPAVSDGDFDGIVRGALEAVGGVLLFKMRVADVEADQHVAAASVGAGSTRQFLLLSLPASGGRLKVEPTTHSQNPLARLAESYAGLMDVFKAAA
jgi:hypothetical protein